MLQGMIFDIREFTIQDGPGLRTTVFLKGCPLSCQWCHNPEGQSPFPQIMHSPAGDRLAGKEYSSTELAAILNRQQALLNSNEGGVTFSGGEPLQQADFVAEVIDQLSGIHVLLDTCGYGSEEKFKLLLKRVNLVYYDLKLIDNNRHKLYTGQNNDLILKNLRIMSASEVPFVIRVPLIPSITDTPENMSSIAATIRNLPGLLHVDLLPYNKAAGAKYKAAGMQWKPDFDENKPVNVDLSIFTDAGITVFVK